MGRDFTGFGIYLLVALVVLIIGGFVLMFFPSPLGQKIYSIFGTLLFSFFIVYDTQLIVGGKHKKHQFSVDDYVFAAINLYLDIINLFLLLLQLFGSRN